MVFFAGKNCCTCLSFPLDPPLCVNKLTVPQLITLRRRVATICERRIFVNRRRRFGCSATRLTSGRGRELSIWPHHHHETSRLYRVPTRAVPPLLQLPQLCVCRDSDNEGGPATQKASRSIKQAGCQQQACRVDRRIKDDTIKNEQRSTKH